MFSEVFASAFGDPVDGNTGCIGGDEGARFSDGIHFFHQLLFDVQAFDDHFYDPVGGGDGLQVVFKVSGGDMRQHLFVIDRRGVLFDRSLQAVVDQLVAFGLVGGICFVQAGRDNIQQLHLATNVGEVAGDAGSHDPGAQNGYRLNSSLHCSCCCMRASLVADSNFFRIMSFALRRKSGSL